MKKNREIKIKVSTEEFEKIKSKAQRLGLATATFCRLIILSARTPITLQ